MPKAMIITVGGTPAPIVKTIQAAQPVFVSFLASQQTAESIPGIRKEVGFNFESTMTLVNDADDILHCFNKAEEAAAYVIQKGFAAADVLVDYTGGTKNMTAAVVLATVAHGFSFSYVGGSERTKDGVGIVVNGKETVRREVNPWDFFAVEQRRKIAVLFNHNQFDAAKVLISEAHGKVSPRLLPLFAHLGKLVEGFRLWDRFKHAEALKSFGDGLADSLMQLGATLDDHAVQLLSEQAKMAIGALKKINNLSAGGKKLCQDMIYDLISNADRRFAEGKIDDAIMRLYRVVEMIAQERLENKYGLKSDAMDISGIRSEALRRKLLDNKGADGKIKVSQTMAYAVLEEIGDPIGKQFQAQKARFKDVQSARNYSYLAHGVKSAEPSAYKTLRDFVLDLAGNPQLVTFPKIDL